MKNLALNDRRHNIYITLLHKNNRMKKIITLLNMLSLSALLSVTACNNSANDKTTNVADTVTTRVDTAMQDTKQAAQNAVNDVKGDNGNPDSNFVVKATAANMEEIALIKAGMDMGTSKELKMHAKMMMTDHKGLAAKVKAYSAGKHYTLPDNDNGKSADDMDKLNKNSKGADWDKAWASMMVDKHNDAIDLFEKGQNNVKDADLKALITNTLPTLHSHLDMMKQLQDKLK